MVFLGQYLGRYGSQVLALSITSQGYSMIGLCLGLTFLSHCWAGMVWGWLLKYLHYPRWTRWAMAVYLQTNLAKYLPGNIWHFVGRVTMSQGVDIPLKIGILSVVLESVFMAVAAVAVALILAVNSPVPWSIRWLGLGILLMGVHPQLFRPVLEGLARSKRRVFQQDSSPDHPNSSPPLTYPWRPLLGELIFVSLRGISFWAIVMALYPFPGHQVGLLISGFSVAWVLGLVIPGAPGGLGVFEATALGVLGGLMPPPVILAALALYRVISTLAEIIGAGLGYVVLKTTFPI
jgi:uncharacterized membrane protein YbhN (UPF0104 family)